MSGLLLQKLTIPVTDEMAASVQARGLLRSEAAARGVPPGIEPTAERRPKVNGMDWCITDYVYRWYVVIGLPEPLKPHWQSYGMYRREWNSVRALMNPGPGQDIHITGLGYYDVEQAEALALEILAATAEARGRAEMDMSKEDKERSAEALRTGKGLTDG